MKTSWRRLVNVETTSCVDHGTTASIQIVFSRVIKITSIIFRIGLGRCWIFARFIWPEAAIQSCSYKKVFWKYAVKIYRVTPMPKCDFTLRHGCYPVNLLHIFRTPLCRNTSEWLLLFDLVNVVTQDQLGKVIWDFHVVSYVFSFLYSHLNSDFVTF